GVVNTDRAVDSQAGVGPVANPIAIVKVRMTGVTVADVCFVMAAAGAQRSSPARVTVVLCVNMAAAQEVLLLLAVDPAGDVAQRVCVGVDETMTGSDVTRRTDADEAERRTTRMRFVDALIQFSQSIAYIRKPVYLAAEGVLQIFLREDMEL